MSKTLYAFYDFEVAPVTFDYFVFLTLAEIHRRKNKLTNIKLILVPGTHDGYRELDIFNTSEEKDWRVDNIVLTGWRLIPTITGVTLCTCRGEAEFYQKELAQNIFPEEYKVTSPVGDFTIVNYTYNMGMGEDSPSLIAPYQARLFAQHWINSISPDPRDVVTITIRTNSIQPERNSNLGAWTEFAETLDPDRFLPVIVPETETLFTGKPEIMKKFPSFDSAALNIPLRIAIYELAYLNLGVSNGPRVLSYFTNNRYITYKIAVEASPSARQQYLSSCGYTKGSRPANAGQFQKWVWEDDTFDTIKSTFEEMVKEIDIVEVGPPKALETRPFVPLDERLALGIRMQHAGHLERAEFIFGKLIQEIPNNPDVLHALGRVSIQRGNCLAASEFLAKSLKYGQLSLDLAMDYSQSLFMEKKYSEASHWASEAVAIEPKSLEALQLLSECHQKDGKVDAALEISRRALAFEPNNLTINMHIAELYYASDSLEKAFSYFAHALDLAAVITTDTSTKLFDRLGRIFADVGHAAGSLAALLIANSMREGTSIDPDMLTTVRTTLEKHPPANG